MPWCHDYGPVLLVSLHQLQFRAVCCVVVAVTHMLPGTRQARVAGGWVLHMTKVPKGKEGGGWAEM